MPLGGWSRSGESRGKALNGGGYGIQTELDSRPGVFGSGRSVERRVQISTRIDQEEEFDLIEVQFDNIYRLGMT